MLDRNRSLRCLIGLEIILIGLLANKDAVEQMLANSQSLTSWWGRSVIFGWQILLVAAGALIILPQHRRWRVKGLIVAGSMIACGAVNVLLVQLLCKVMPIASGWRSLAAGNESHQLGFRGRTIEYSKGDFVIVLLGDSQVEAKSGSVAEMPGSRLEEHLAQLVGRRVRVVSLGAGGYGQDQQLEVFKEYCRGYRADLVIVWETETNDIWNNVFPTHFRRNGDPKPTYWLEHGELRGPTEAVGQLLFSHPVKLIAFWQRAVTLRRLRTRDDDWEKRLPAPYSPARSHSGPVNRRWETLRIERAFFGEHLESEKSHLAIGFTPRSPRMEYGIQLTRRLLRAIQDTAAAQGGRMIVFQAKVTANHPIAAIDPTLMYRTHYPSNTAPPAEEMYLWKGCFYRVSPVEAEANWRDVNREFETYVLPVTVPDWPASEKDSHLSPHANDQVMKDLAVAIGHLIPNRNDSQ